MNAQRRRELEDPDLHFEVKLDVRFMPSTATPVITEEESMTFKHLGEALDKARGGRRSAQTVGLIFIQLSLTMTARNARWILTEQEGLST